jgi:2-polyprenyl-3-methyl-5-hydroxy-6-metoxy-1,4-benzoquinol methylase
VVLNVKNVQFVGEKMNKEEIIFRKKRAKKSVERLMKFFNLNKILKSKKKILDFGSGYGFFTKELSRKFPDKKIIGIDINKKRIEFAKKNNKNTEVNYKVTKEIIGKYDAIILMFVIHEIKNHKKKLKKLASSLNKEGILLIYDFRKVAKKEFRILYNKDLVHRGADFEKEYEEHNRWNIREFQKICEDVGLKTKTIKPDKKYFLFYMGLKNE